MGNIATLFALVGCSSSPESDSFEVAPACQELDVGWKFEGRQQVVKRSDAVCASSVLTDDCPKELFFRLINGQNGRDAYKEVISSGIVDNIKVVGAPDLNTYSCELVDPYTMTNALDFFCGLSGIYYAEIAFNRSIEVGTN